MELKDRFNILKQGVEIAQSKGVLSLDDAVFVKKALESVKTNTNLDIAAKILTKTVQVAQSKGCYTLKDAYIIYVALDGIDEEIVKSLTPQEETCEKPDECRKEPQQAEN